MLLGCLHTGFFGQPCEMEPIVALAERYNLKIIEDCAEAHFATYKGKTVGSFGAAAGFSTYVAHTITTGVVVTTNDRELMEISRSLIVHGRACTCEECIASNPAKVCPLRMKTEMDKRFMPPTLLKICGMCKIICSCRGIPIMSTIRS